MQTMVKKWGNSASVRIPTSVMKAARLGINRRVDVREEEGRIVIEPVREGYDLDVMLSAITPENLHSEVDFGMAVGMEVI